MKLLARIILGLSAVILLASFSGCTTKTNKDTKLPWSRPAQWEQRGPLGTMMGQ